MNLIWLFNEFATAAYLLATLSLSDFNEISPSLREECGSALALIVAITVGVNFAKALIVDLVEVKAYLKKRC